MQLKNFLLLFVVFAFELEAWSTVSEYWIIEKPAALVLYNQYEQRLTDTEKSLLPGFSAWRILENDHVMSDQFSHTIKTELDRKIYYIQISVEGEPVNGSQAGQINTFKNARVQGDTVRIKNSGRLSLQSGDKQHDLSEGMLIQRIFLYRNRTFARDIAGKTTGWIEGNGPANWEVYLPANSDQALEKQIFSRVDRIFKSYNKRLDKLFTYLNKQYDKSQISPQWIAEKSPLNLKYMLVPLDYRNRFSDSQSYLVQELHDLLYGSAYQLSATDGQIVISNLSR